MKVHWQNRFQFLADECSNSLDFLINFRATLNSNLLALH